MKSNADLLGRQIKPVRTVPALVSTENRIDVRCLTTEEQTVQRANSPRHYNLTLVIKRLEEEAADPEATPYQREQRLGFAELHRETLKNITDEKPL